MRRLVLVPASVLTALCLAYGCFLAVDLLALEHRRDTASFDGTVDHVQLDVRGDGVVRVVGDRAAGAEVEVRWKEGLKQASWSASVVEGRLLLRTRCPEVFNTFCTVSATVHVPMGTTVAGTGDATVEVVDVGATVDLAVDDGAVRVEGADGSVQVRTDNGSIRVANSTGDLDLASSNGAVRTEAVAADRVRAESDNGSVHLDLAASPTRVEARSDNGSVTVLLPPDAPGYATDVSSDNGGTETLIRIDPAAERTIVAASDNGSVSLRYRG